MEPYKDKGTDQSIASEISEIQEECPRQIFHRQILQDPQSNLDLATKHHKPNLNLNLDKIHQQHLKQSSIPHDHRQTFGADELKDRIMLFDDRQRSPSDRKPQDDRMSMQLSSIETNEKKVHGSKKELEHAIDQSEGKIPVTTESVLSSKGGSDHGTLSTNNNIHASRDMIYRNDTDGSHFLSRSDIMQDSLRVKASKNIYDRAGLSSSQISSY